MAIAPHFVLFFIRDVNYPSLWLFNYTVLASFQWIEKKITFTLRRRLCAVSMRSLLLLLSFTIPAFCKMGNQTIMLRIHWKCLCQKWTLLLTHAIQQNCSLCNVCKLNFNNRTCLPLAPIFQCIHTMYHMPCQTNLSFSHLLTY